MFYLDAAGFLTAVPVRTTPTTFTAGAPVKMLNAKYYPGFTGLCLDGRGYDVSRDGRRFLMVKESASAPAGAGAPTSTLTVIVNWVDELKARMPR